MLGWLRRRFRPGMNGERKPNYVKGMECRAKAAANRHEADNPRHYPEVRDALRMFAAAYENLADRYEQGER
jgi:hypothetical protein